MNHLPDDDDDDDDCNVIVKNLPDDDDALIVSTGEELTIWRPADNVDGTLVPDKRQ